MARFESLIVRLEKVSGVGGAGGAAASIKPAGGDVKPPAASGGGGNYLKPFSEEVLKGVDNLLAKTKEFNI